MVTKTMEHKGILLCGSKKGKMDLFAAILNRYMYTYGTCKG